MTTLTSNIKYKYDTKKQAEAAKKRLEDRLNEKGHLAIQDLALVCVVPSGFQGMGWKNLDQCQIKKNRITGYTLYMPKEIEYVEESRL